MPKALLYIGNNLSKHGYNQTTIETLSRGFEEMGFKVYKTSSKKNQIFRSLDMMFTTLIKAPKVAYIIIDTYSTSSFWYAFFCSQIARIFNKKYIPILHGGNLPNRLQKNPKLCNLIFKNSFTNVAPSGYLKNHFEQTGFKNTILIPNAIELKNYNYKKRELIQPNLLWVRAFAEIYNPKMAIDVLLELQKKYPNATLTMVGNDKDGSLEICKNYTYQQKVNVSFTGKLTKQEWTKLSKNFDIFINTTHFDNTPVSVLEALALGLPVVTTNVGGIPFLLENQQTALLVNDNETNEMVKSIENLIENSQLVQNLSTNGRILVEKFDWEIVKKEWERVLNLLLMTIMVFI